MACSLEPGLLVLQVKNVTAGVARVVASVGGPQLRFGNIALQGRYHAGRIQVLVHAQRAGSQTTASTDNTGGRNSSRVSRKRGGSGLPPSDKPELVLRLVARDGGG